MATMNISIPEPLKEFIEERVTEKGFTIIPLRAYFKGGRVKIEIGLARGKKSHDKRESIKKKDIERETRQAVRERG